MAPRRRSGTLSGNALSYEFQVVGRAEPKAFDLYHSMLTMPGWELLGILLASYLVLNALFALGFLATGGVENAAPGSFADAFFFSVQTMATIGYGAMYPHSLAAHLLVVVESVIGLMVTAVATGLVFVRFSRVRGRVVFSRQVAIGPMDGVPTVMIRVGNARGNRIYDCELKLMLTRTTRTAEGVAIYRTEDLKLVRDVAPTLGQSWMLLHRIDESSPLFGATPESLKAVDAELIAALSGTDDTALQPIHGRFTWESENIVFGARLVDVLTEQGNLVILDLDKFHTVEATRPVPGFPWPRA
ncbi:MAG: hypothetical protein K1X89_26290 [Myxococcaceae bacterium]|nr:hypothetical protein [Myxococcaceae bacterium]